MQNRARHRLAVEPAAFAFHEDREIRGRRDFGHGVLPRLAGFVLDDFTEFVIEEDGTFYPLAGSEVDGPAER